MNTTQLTDQQIAEIEARANAATPGPWCTDSWEIYQGGPDDTPSLMKWIGETCRAEDPDGGRNDAAFIAHARTDVPALLAEVARLKQQRKYLLGQLAKKDAASGAGDKALAEFLAAKPEDDTATAIADADNPTHLRWGLGDVMWGDDDSVIVLLSGPDGEPYWLELDVERAAVLREDLAGPHE